MCFHVTVLDSFLAHWLSINFWMWQPWRSYQCQACEPSSSLHFLDTWIWNVPYSPGPNHFIETGITCLESPSPSWQIPGFLGSVQGTIHETHSVDAFVDVFSGHFLVDGVFSLVSTLLCRSHSFRSKLEGLNLFIWWKTSSIFLQGCLSYYSCMARIIFTFLCCIWESFATLRTLFADLFNSRV